MNFTAHFSVNQINFLCHDLKALLTNSRVIDCSAVDSGRFVLVFEKADKQKTLFFCLKPLFTRFHLITQKLKTSSFALSDTLQDAKILSIAAMNEDRIVRFEFQKGAKKYSLICEFFSKYPNYYLTDSDQQIIFSFHPTKHKEYHPPKKNQSTHPSTAPLLSHAELEESYQKMEQEWLSSQHNNELQTLLTQKLKKLILKKRNLTKQLSACENWQAVQHHADLIKAHLGQYKKGMHALKVWDWLSETEILISLDPQKIPQEEMSGYYKRAKKLMNGLEPIQEQIRLVNNQICAAKLQIESLSTLSPEEIAAAIDLLSPSLTKKELEKRKEKKSLPYREFFSEKKIAMWVGKNARSNEILTFRLANGNDWWLHVNGRAGSHVVIKLNKIKEPDSETLEDAIQLALFNSKARSEGKAEVCITQKKYVTRFGRDQPGKVQISQHTTAYRSLDLERCRKINERGSQ